MGTENVEFDESSLKLFEEHCEVSTNNKQENVKVTARLRLSKSAKTVLDNLAQRRKLGLVFSQLILQNIDYKINFEKDIYGSTIDAIKKKESNKTFSISANAKEALINYSKESGVSQNTAMIIFFNNFIDSLKKKK